MDGGGINGDGGGWKTKRLLSQAELDRMAWQQREAYEKQIISEWESRPHANWSGL